MKMAPNRLAKFSTSGPLMALLGLGLVYAFTSPAVLVSPAYDGLFQTVPQWLWATGCTVLGCVGYYGLYADNRRCWLIAHGASVGLFIPMGIYFGMAGSLTGLSTYSALALNAWVRYAQLYKEPAFGHRR